MANVLVDMKADRAATLAMMIDAKAVRDAAGHPDPRSDDILTRALAGDWSWSGALAGRVVETPQLPPAQPAADASTHRPDGCTDAQVRFLNVLFSKVAKLTGTEPVAVPDDLSKKAASALIDKLSVQVEKLERARPPGLTLPAEIRQAATPQPVNDVPEGRYAVRGSDRTVDFYKVDCPTEGRWAGYVFASLLTGAPGDWAKQRLSKPATATLLARIQAAGVEDSARLFGEKTESCGNCGSPLSDPQSRVAGYGETCAGKHGYWYPTLAEALEILNEGVDPESNTAVR